MKTILINSCACYGSNDLHECYCNLNNINMKTQTAVEWLIEQLTPSISLQQKHIDDLKEQAKAMEKEQIIQAYYQNGWNDNDNEHNAEQYYNETYNKTI